jgi:hypothetical protein
MLCISMPIDYSSLVHVVNSQRPNGESETTSNALSGAEVSADLPSTAMPHISTSVVPLESSPTNPAQAKQGDWSVPSTVARDALVIANQGAPPDQFTRSHSLHPVAAKQPSPDVSNITDQPPTLQIPIETANRAPSPMLDAAANPSILYPPQMHAPVVPNPSPIDTVPNPHSMQYADHGWHLPPPPHSMQRYSYPDPHGFHPYPAGYGMGASGYGPHQQAYWMPPPPPGPPGNQSPQDHVNLPPMPGNYNGFNRPYFPGHPVPMVTQNPSSKDPGPSNEGNA